MTLRSTLRQLSLWCAVGLGAAATVSVLYAREYYRRLPDFTAPELHRALGGPVRSREADERVLSQVPYESHVTNPFVAVEDKRFYEHNGFSWASFAAAHLRNLRYAPGELFFERPYAYAGASTIEQQIAKNLRLARGEERSRVVALGTLKYKLEEILLAHKISADLSKAEILTVYVNTNNYGANTVGIEAAARDFFDERIDELSDKELFALVKTINSPNNFYPHPHRIAIGAWQDRRARLVRTTDALIQNVRDDRSRFWSPAEFETMLRQDLRFR